MKKIFENSLEKYCSSKECHFPIKNLYSNWIIFSIFMVEWNIVHLINKDINSHQDKLNDKMAYFSITLVNKYTRVFGIENDASAIKHNL